MNELMTMVSSFSFGVDDLYEVKPYKSLFFPNCYLLQKLEKQLTTLLFLNVLPRMDILSLRVGSCTHSSRNRSLSARSSFSKADVILIQTKKYSYRYILMHLGTEKQTFLRVKLLFSYHQFKHMFWLKKENNNNSQLGTVIWSLSQHCRLLYSACFLQYAYFMCDSHNLAYKVLSFVTTVWTSSQEIPLQVYLDDEGCL